MEGYFHAVQKRPHIVGDGKNIIAGKCAQTQGKPDKGTQYAESGHGSRDIGIVVGRANLIQHVFVYVFFQFAYIGQPAFGSIASHAFLVFGKGFV